MRDDHLLKPDVPAPRFTEQQLVERAQVTWRRGDFEAADEAFGQLRRQAAPWLLGVAEREGLNRDEADDVVAEMFLDLWAVLERDEPVSNVTGFMCTVLQRRIVDFWRSRYGRSKEAKDKEKATPPRELREADGEPHDWDEVPAEQAPIYEEVDDRAFRACLNPILQALSEAERQVLLLRHYKGLSVEETARQLKLSVDAVKKRTVSAIKHARAIAVQQNLIEAEVLPQ